MKAVVLVAVLTVVAGFVAFRPSVLVVQSDSMRPALVAGDLVVSRPRPARQLGPGDVVTFRDRDRGDRLVTHRVRAVASRGDDLRFTTRGDANSGVEEWAVPADGAIRTLALRIPSGGRVVAMLRSPAGWAAIAVSGALARRRRVA